MRTNRKRHKRHLGQRPRRHDSPGKVQFSPRSGSDWTWESLDFKRWAWMKLKEAGIIGAKIFIQWKKSSVVPRESG